MAGDVAISILICTRDRTSSLAATLAALRSVVVPAERSVEVVVVDNASRDDVAAAVQAVALPAFSVRTIREVRPGVAHARNLGLRAAQGEILVYLDDDARPNRDWLQRLCAPIWAGADAVAGGVRLPPSVLRPWMEPIHRAWLASTEYLDPAQPVEFVTANAAIHRRVLARVPAFDPELGPGASGQGEDALFAWQLTRAGFRLVGALDAVVEHHVDDSRTAPAWFRRTAVRRGGSLAYQRHHWGHGIESRVMPRLAIAATRWLRRRLADGAAASGAQLLATERLAFLWRWRFEASRPRNYERYGLVKGRGVRT